MAHNVFEGDLQCLLNQDVSSVQVDTCAFLHKADVSSISLCEKLTNLSLVKGKKDKEIIAMKLEVSRLTTELAEMEKLRKNLREQEVRSTDLETTLKNATKKATGLEENLCRLQTKVENRSWPTRLPRHMEWDLRWPWSRSDSYVPRLIFLVWMP
ncbi:hypothetical protein DEO72_LG11g2562 [Vigna unguiculata]|uniref:Uncharacterized protein n=1 Tax=Vigna unguiculata TaxID=3917 RepID=A0A4D6NRJ6_VIGUN|nr:hypothetical protein DEO72_LG11g2562 [Vigna unguiculata]